MKCKEPTKKYPNGRTGTATGHVAHRNAGEESCGPCRDANREYNREYRERNGDRKRELDRRWRKENLERKRENDRRYYKENAERIKKRSRDWHHDNKEKANDYSRKWREANRERFREQVNKWHRENRVVFAEYLSEWREKNKDLISSYSRKRRMSVNSLPSEFYSHEDVTNTYGTTCHLCGGDVDVNLPKGKSTSPNLDHVHPVNRDGCPGDILSNIRWTHAICNIKKRDKLLHELELPFSIPTGDEWT